jgi:predicted transcriptional regulator
MLKHIKDLTTGESVAIFRALGSGTRAKIVELLSAREMNIGELSQALGLTQPSVTKHVQILEEAGVVVSDYVAAPQGTQKRCRRVFERLLVDLEPRASDDETFSETELPIGMYTDISAAPTCGLATRDKFIGLIDSPLAFFLPERAHAEIIWTASGWVEYAIPNTLPLNIRIKSMEILMEVGSEFPGYKNDYPSDITIWVNEVEIGTWRSQGDFGGTRGHLNPNWYPDNMNQWGVLKTVTIDDEGSFVDGQRMSNVVIDALHIRPWEVSKIRIGNSPESECQGGFTLFGHGFGNYQMGLIVRLKHEPSARHLGRKAPRPAVRSSNS